MKEVRLAQYVMGTVVEVVLWPAAGEENARQAAACALCEFERVERVFSRFDPSSELSRVNGQAAVRPVIVSDEFFALTQRGLQYSRHSAGAFSITLQPLIGLWERSAKAGQLPTDGQIGSTIALCDAGGVVLDASRRSIHFAVSGMSLNFDGLAKGYAVDRARAVLSEQGVTHAMIDAGSSSIAALYPEGSVPAWHVGLRHPGDSGRCIARLSLDCPAVSTSGAGERGFTIANRWYSHVIDPTSGLCLERLVSATAAGEYAELMEVASKILLLRGCKKGLAVCENLGWVADGLTVTQTSHRGGLAIEYPDNLVIEFEPEYDTDSTCVH